MKPNQNIRSIAGLLIWIGLVAGGIFVVRRSMSAAPVASRQIVDYLKSTQRVVKLHSPQPIVLGVGDPVFRESDSGTLEPVGVITELDYPAGDDGNPVKLAWVDGATVKLLSRFATLDRTDYLEYHTTSESLAWIGQTMLNADKRQEITQLIVDAYGDHQDELIETFEPLIKQTIADGAKIIRDQIAIEIRTHRDDIQKIAQRYQSDVFEKDILPVLEAEVWPIVQEESLPLATQVGMEIWQEVSVWRFGWRYLYDAAPLPQRNLSKKEFERFLKSKVVPVLKSHIPDAVQLQTVLLKKVSQNEKLKQALAEAGDQVFNDPEVQSLVKEIFSKSIVENEKLKQSIEATWQSDSAVAALRIANDRLQPVVTEIGRSLFGSPRTGITPEFARVLRNRVLHKDQRWLTLIQPRDDAGAPADSDHADDGEDSADVNNADDSDQGPVMTLPLRPLSGTNQTSYFPAGVTDE